ncbi:MAG: GNAT family N-acetyltransferase [Acidobacteria bacterium]|nr:GNAT family N-acetyltransferase [Acidobacteriota bacterium]
MKKPDGHILETERTILRELTTDDAQFNLDLLNQPSFIKYIGDRGVRTIEQSIDFIESRYRKSYAENGFGLNLVEIKPAGGDKTLTPIGICGFVKRDTLPDVDIGFAFLPDFEKKGYAFETADAMMKFGKEELGLTRVLAITTRDNKSSQSLLKKLGFEYEKNVKMSGDDEELFLFSTDL